MSGRPGNACEFAYDDGTLIQQCAVQVCLVVVAPLLVREGTLGVSRADGSQTVQTESFQFGGINDLAWFHNFRATVSENASPTTCHWSGLVYTASIASWDGPG